MMEQVPVSFDLPLDQVGDLNRYAQAVGLTPSEALSGLLQYVELGWLAHYATGGR